MDDVFKHLVLTTLTVDVEQVELFSPTNDIVHHSGDLSDVQLDFLLVLAVTVFHSESALALEVSLRQENGPGAVSESVIMNLHLPLVCLHVVTPDLLQVGVVLGHWLVDVQHTESNLEWE